MDPNFADQRRFPTFCNLLKIRQPFVAAALLHQSQKFIMKQRNQFLRTIDRVFNLRQNLFQYALLQ